MHILHVYKDYYPVLGGIENHLRWLAEAQVGRGHKVTVLVTNPAGRGTSIRVENGVEVIRASRLTTIASTPISLDLLRRLRRQNPDIVHLHFPYPLDEVGQWLFRRGQATVMTYHSDVIRQKGILRFYDPLLRRILRNMDRIMPTSEPYIQSSPYLSPIADHCTVIPLGVNVKRFSKPHPQQVAAIHRRHPGPILLFVGRLRYYKGLNYLIEAMPNIPATLLIVGTGPDAAALGEQAYMTGVADRVRFLGDIGDEFLPGYYHAADLFVLPSSERSEAFGIVLLEAMAAGTPLVSTELGTGTSWVNRHDETGVVAPARDASALASTINELLENPERRQQMGVRAQVRAFAEFDLEILVDRTLAVYQDVLSQKSIVPNPPTLPADTG